MGGEERSSRVYLGDVWSTNNCPLSFNVIPGRTRKCFNVAVPSAWIKRESVRWCNDERYFERERMIEMFTLSRSYNELRERLGVEKTRCV